MSHCPNCKVRDRPYGWRNSAQTSITHRKGDLLGRYGERVLGIENHLVSSFHFDSITKKSVFVACLNKSWPLSHHLMTCPRVYSKKRKAFSMPEIRHHSLIWCCDIDRHRKLLFCLSSLFKRTCALLLWPSPKLSSLMIFNERWV